MRISFSQAAYVARSFFVIAMAGSVMACTDSATPPPTSGLLELSVRGDVVSFMSGVVQVGSQTQPLQADGEGFRASFPNVPFGQTDLQLELFEAPSVVSDQQTTQAFAVASQAVMFTGPPVTVEVMDGTLMRMLELIGRSARVTLRDDPCVLTTRFQTDSRVVDADRALYGTSFSDLITFVFVQDTVYAGGDVFALADDTQSFDEACASDTWRLADTLACVVTDDDTLDCLHHEWARP